MANYTEKGYDVSLNGYWKGTASGDNFGYPRNYFCAETLRNVCIAFGNFFNNIYAVRRDKFGQPIKNIQVPIKFGPRMKAFDQRKELINGKPFYIPYPNLTWRLDSQEFDSERFSGQYAERTFYADSLENAGMDYEMSEQFWTDVQPVPTNLSFTMELKCDLISDAQDIVEQITTRFTPDVHLNVKEFWFFNKRRSLKMTLEGSPSWSIESESMGEEEKREITVSFSFKVYAVLYKPIQKASIIDKINVYVDSNRDDIVDYQTYYGDYNDTIKKRYDFEDIYGCKIGLVSSISGEPQTIYYPETSSYVTDYYYKAGNEYTTYPAGSNLLKSVTATFNPITREFDITKSYYELGGWGEQPENFNLKYHQVIDNFGDSYSNITSGYYTMETDTINKIKKTYK